MIDYTGGLARYISLCQIHSCLQSIRNFFGFITAFIFSQLVHYPLNTTQTYPISNMGRKVTSIKKKIRELYSSNKRQQTRAGLGATISGFLTVSGLYHMAIPAAAAAVGLEKSSESGEKIKQWAKENNVRLRKRDKLGGILAGAVEKLTLTFVLLGQDEWFYIGNKYGIDAGILNTHTAVLAAGSGGVHVDNGNLQFVPTSEGDLKVIDQDNKVCAKIDAGVSGEGNILWNTPGDTIKDLYHLKEGVMSTSEHVQGTVLAGTTLAAQEHIANRVRSAGRDEEQTSKTVS